MSRTFHSTDGLYFTRNDDGSVTITKTDDQPIAEDESNVLFKQTLDAGSWVSAVLTMTHFNERSGDFDIWLRHHKGEEDILAQSEDIPFGIPASPIDEQRVAEALANYRDIIL